MPHTGHIGRDHGRRVCEGDDHGRRVCEAAGPATTLRGQPGINFVSLESVNGLADQRFNPVNWLHDSLHPNERGHQAMLVTFEAWLKAHLSLPVTPAPAAGARVTSTSPGDTALPNPPCSMTASVNSCQARTRDWILAQVFALWPAAIGVLFALIGLWMISVGLLSLLPRPGEPAPAGPPASGDGPGALRG